MYAANHLKKENPVILKGRKITSSQALKYAWIRPSFRTSIILRRVLGVKTPSLPPSPTTTSTNAVGAPSV